MCKLRRKLCNAKIYPLEVQILQIILDNLGNYSTFWAHIIKTIFSKLEFLFSVLGSMVSKIKKNPKIYPNSLGRRSYYFLNVVKENNLELLAYGPTIKVWAREKKRYLIPDRKRSTVRLPLSGQHSGILKNS